MFPSADRRLQIKIRSVIIVTIRLTNKRVSRKFIDYLFFILPRINTILLLKNQTHFYQFINDCLLRVIVLYTSIGSRQIFGLIL